MDGRNEWMVLWAMVACGGLSLVPFRLARGWRCWPIGLMGVGLGLYLLNGVEDATGQALMAALMMFLWLNGMAKMGLLRLMLAWAGGSRRRLLAMPQRRIQLALSAVILAGCTQWCSALGIEWRAVRNAYGLARIRGVQSVNLIEPDEAPRLAAGRSGG